jgi:uncharacterized protein (TIGR02680 family)
MSRWRPSRAGIFNIWEYDDQVFEFGDGRLVLRGRNGSGKSNALSLIFPFVLDGVMSATRMDPMGGGRSMKSLLLGRDDDDASGGRYRDDSGQGYVWMEFERPVDTGEPEHLTIGVGARATQQRDANAWFFVTPLRIGDELQLAIDDVPKGQRELAESLAGCGDVYTTAEDYRIAVDRNLFGLGSVRWRTLLDLLLTLRRPHLAGKLDTDHLSFTLSSGLAELDPALIADVAHSFDDLDAMHDELDGVTGALAAVERFLPAYRTHLLGIARGRAAHLIAVDGEQRDITAELRTSERERSEVEATVAQATALVEENRRERDRIDTEIEAIQTSQAFQDAAALAEVEQRAAASQRAADAAQDARIAQAAQFERAVEHESSATRTSARRRDELDRAFDEWRDLAVTVRLRDVATSVDGFTAEGVLAAATARAAEVVEVDELAAAASAAAAAARRVTEHRRRLDEAHADARRQQSDAEHALELTVDELDADLDVWLDDLDPIVARARTVVDGPLPDARGVRADLDVGDPACTVALDAVVADLRTALAVTTQRFDAAAEVRRTTIAGLVAERRRVADEPNPGPPTNPTRPDAARGDRPGAPLFMCVDFAASIADDDRAGLESALAAAGLLDARIVPGGAVGGSDALDATIDSAGAPTAGESTLADVLTPLVIGDLGVADIAAALRTIALDDGLVRVGRDGSWRLGPLAGRFRKQRAEFIGHEARERRRAARLAELDAEITDEEAALTDVESVLAELSSIVDDLASVAVARPSTAPLVAAQNLITQCEARTGQLAEQLAAATTEADIADEVATTTSADLHRRADALAVPIVDAERSALRHAIERCRHLGAAVAAALSRLDEATIQVDAATAARLEASTYLDAARARATEAGSQADDDRLRYDTLFARVGDDVQAAVKALEGARRHRDVARRASAELSERRRLAESAIATLTERCIQLRQRLDAVAVEVTTARRSMETVCVEEVAEVLALDGVGPGADALDAARTVLADAAEVPDDATNRMEREHRTVLLDGLRAGHDPSMPKFDGFDVVRVGTAEGEIPIGALARRLRDDRDRLGLLLSDREREIFETHLLARVGDALRELLFEADHFEQRINAEMAKAPTSSGMTVELSWGVDSDDPTVKQAVKTLRYSPETMGPEQREVLRAFFTEQIQARRAADPGRSFVDVLTAALDYRSWHSFTFSIRSVTGGRRQVTRKYFRELSGGEAATVLHLPLFAAAAAHYASGSIAGPRLIALDEAFAGIDDDMRGKLMGLLIQLDLDVLLTSHEFWGFYAQVPNLVLYDLTRRPPTPGVFAQRLEWSSTEPAT